MKIYLASDHAGFAIKESVRQYLQRENYDVQDLGAYSYEREDDYPDIISKAAEEVSKNPDATRAIIFGHSGQGEAMCANRFPHVRAVVYYGLSEDILILSRRHNNANILSLGGGFLFEDEACLAVSIWLTTEFSGEERHVRRIKKLQ
jgi:ribose 5-phosphate isomerase B